MSDLAQGHVRAQIENDADNAEKIIAEAAEMASDYDPSETPDLLSFDEFCALACRYPLASLARGAEFDNNEKAKGRLASDQDFNRLPGNDSSDMFWSETSYLSANLAILSAESMLLVFAQNLANADVEVTWEFGPLVNAGWASCSDFVAGARRRQKLLIATEGASDARILKRALEVLRPDVADFFNFVDVDERHHFWGTGHLLKFAEGLLRIDLLNQVLFVLDNDAEGVDAFRKLQKLNLPGNMRAMLLPDLEELKSFPTLGPEGMNVSDINGRAAAIKCYLDFRLEYYSTAQMTWSNYKKEVDAWHGALDFKQSYAKHFHEQSNDSLITGQYNTSKLIKLLDNLIVEAGHLRAVV